MCGTYVPYATVDWNPNIDYKVVEHYIMLGAKPMNYIKIVFIE